MTEKQMCDAFEHCDPARYQEFYNAVRVLAARPDVNLRREVQFLLLAADQGTRLYWARVKMTEACKAVGIEKTDTGYKIYNRIRERNALMSNEEKIVTAVAQAIQPPAADQPEPVRPEDYTVDKPAAPAKSKKTARALADALDGMDTLVDVLNRKKLLSDDEVEVCERVMALADAFRVGIEYGEALKNA